MAGPVKILQVVGALGLGGIEGWLTQVTRAAPRDWQIDFLVRRTLDGSHEAALKGLGCRILAGLDRRNPLRFVRLFNQAVRQGGPYQVVHSHVGPFNGIVMLAAARQGVPVRISHAHNDNRFQEAGSGLLRRRYLALSRQLLARYSTDRLAVSRQAAEYLYGESAALFCPGIDFSSFDTLPERAVVRRSVGLADDAIVLGFVGRLDEQKDPQTLLRVVRHAHGLDRRVRLLLVGEGPLRQRLEEQAAALGISGIVHFHGAAPAGAVPGLLAAMDVFLFPSLWEGLGLALVEAQAAGLPCLISEAVPAEAVVIPALVHRIPSAQTTQWAHLALEVAARSKPTDALDRVRRSQFDLESGVRALGRLYTGQS
jgi:glycosyltransferase involved in cell wall biosynthesis